MLSSRMKCYHLELMLSSGTKCYHLELMLSSRLMLSSVTKCYQLELMLSSVSIVIIWCYHVMLSSGMITPPFLFFLETSLTLQQGDIHFGTLYICTLCNPSQETEANTKTARQRKNIKLSTTGSVCVLDKRTFGREDAMG
jgi:hypothetical protein